MKTLEWISWVSKMKRVVLFACVLTLVTSDVLGQDSESVQWIRYTIKGEEFSVTLPTDPAMTTFTDRDRRQRWLGVYADGVVYAIYTLHGPNPRNALKDSTNQIKSSPGWDRFTGKNLTLNGFKGKQYSSPSPIGGTVQVFATDKHFYRFQAFGAAVDDFRVKQFFSSLLLGKKNEGIEVSDGVGVPFQQAARSGVADEGGPEKLYVGKETDRKAIVIQKPQPSYTESAKRNQLTGTVVFKAVLSSKGSVVNIRTVSGLPYGLTERALETARKIKFIPAVKDGKFVSMWIQLEYNFNLY